VNIGRQPPRGAVFVNQAGRKAYIGPIASWITMSGWAAAAEARYGHAWMVTPAGVLSPGEALAAATRSTRSAGSVPSWRRRLPEAIPTAVKDLRRVRANRRFRHHLDPAPWRSTAVRFVMQLHELACDAGIRLAEGLSVPSVLLVDACQVEEARSWGVRRPGWATAAEYLGELSLLLVGDGLERPAVERRAAELGVPAAFTGTVAYDRMPEHLLHAQRDSANRHDHLAGDLGDLPSTFREQVPPVQARPDLWLSWPRRTAFQPR